MYIMLKAYDILSLEPGQYPVNLSVRAHILVACTIFFDLFGQ